MYHPVAGKHAGCPVLVGCLSEDNTAKMPPFLWIAVWATTTGMQLFKCDPNPMLNISCFLFITLDDYDGISTAIVDFGATNSFVHS